MHTPTQNASFDAPTFPVFYYHTLARPFCKDQNCQCQKGRLKALAYLEAVDRGDLQLGSVKGDVCRHLKNN